MKSMGSFLDEIHRVFFRLEEEYLLPANQSLLFVRCVSTLFHLQTMAVKLLRDWAGSKAQMFYISDTPPYRAVYCPHGDTQVTKQRNICVLRVTRMEFTQ